MSTPRRRGPAPRISQTAVLDVARRLPRDRMTMTAIGAELGVTTAALYRYFPDRAAVLDALARDAVAQLAPPSNDLSWREWLAESARRQRILWREHPELSDLALDSPVSAAGLDLVQTGLEHLTNQGFTRATAYKAMSLVAQVAHSFGLMEARDRTVTLPANRTDLEELRALVPKDQDELFDEFLQTVLDGITVRFAPR